MFPNREEIGLFSVLLFVGAVVGNTALWAFVINYLYGTRYRAWWVTAIRYFAQGMIAVGPVVFLAGWGRELWIGQSWLDLPPTLLIYLAVCWFLGFVVFPLATVQRWRYRIPEVQLSNHTQVVDIAAELDSPPYGIGVNALLARLPGNQIFDVEFTERVLRLPSLPEAWDGLTLMHLTDLHLAGVPDRAFYERVMDRCAAEPPDLLVITGDLADTDDHIRWLIPVLGRLRWKEAAFAVLGNHDALTDVPRINRRLERLGIDLVGSRWIERTLRGCCLIVAGNECPWLGTEPDLSDCPPDGFRLGLAHSPDVLPWARRHRIDLLLAGHNHGGQIRLPALGPILVPSRYSRRYDYGLFHEPPTIMFVGRGLGGTYPLRYNCRPEVTRIVLRTAAVS